jgi:tetratricopeptide (TPR) repeat protein
VLIIKKALVVLFLVTVAIVAMAQSPAPDPPLSDTRLSVHTLVREDIFAGFLKDDMTRFTRGEKNVDLLLEKRPGAKHDLLAWKAGAAYYRAVVAYENKRNDEFQKYYTQALDLFNQATQAGADNFGVHAIRGGTNVVFADRLPKELRAAAWAQAYESYQILWKVQGQMVEKLPLHLRGELLGGLAQSAQRTGRTEEMQQHLDKILALLPDTAYAPVAKKMKEDPKFAATSSVTCMSCHDSGRLNARQTALSSK